MDSPKKVLYVITKANWGGAQKYVYDLACAAHERGYLVTVAYGERGLLGERLDQRGIRTLAVAALGRDVRLAKDWHSFWALVALFRHERPEVVHLNSSKAAGLGALAARVAGVPRIIFTAHGWAFNETRPWWQRLVIRALAATTVYLAHTTLCVSEAIRRDIAWVPFTRGKLCVIHTGIPCPTLLPRAEAREKLLPGKSDKLWIGMTSELHPTKRVVDALDALKIIRAEHPEALLVVLGEGERRDKLAGHIKKLGLEDSAFLVGFVPESASYLAAFDLFLHTSISEALGLVILEAGCASLPTIATRVGGIPEIITDRVSGLLVPPRNPEAIAQATTRLIEDRTYAKKLGAKLHETVLTNFAPEDGWRKTFLLY